MATLKERSDNWNATSLIHRDHRHDKGDGYTETPHKKVHKKETPRKKPGCPGNDGKNHVYVWIGARYIPTPSGRYVDKVQPKWCYRDNPNYNRMFHGYMPFDSRDQHIAWLEAREIQICAGCLKASGKKRMKDDQSNDTSWWYWY
jgi:hypothetical protein